MDNRFRCFIVFGLIKPVENPIEVGREQVGRGGIVRDPILHREVLERMLGFDRSSKWNVAGMMASPIHGADGNREFFIHLRRSGRGLGETELGRRLDALIEVET